MFLVWCILVFYVDDLVQCMYYFYQVLLGCYDGVDVFVGYWDFVDDGFVFVVFYIFGGVDVIFY